MLVHKGDLGYQHTKTQNGTKPDMKKRTTMHAGCMHWIGRTWPPRGTVYYTVVNPSREASRRHQIDPVVAVTKAVDYALVLF